MTVVGSATVEIRASDKYFERDIRAAVRKIRDVSIDIKANTDVSQVRKKIAEVKADQRKRPLNLKADIDLVLVKAKLKSLRERHGRDIEIGVKAKTSEATEKLNKMRALTDKVMKFDVEAKTLDAEERLKAVQERFKTASAEINVDANTIAASAQIGFASRDRIALINAEASTVRAEAQLAMATRPRISRVRMEIDKETTAGLKGLAYAVTGALPMDKIKRTLSAIGANFETLMITMAKTGIIAGNFGASLLTLGANALGIAGGITKVVGLLAMVPAVMGAAGLGITSVVLGFKDFGAALTGDAKALAKLPELAKNAVASLKGLGSELRVATQTKFWEALGTSMQDMVHKIFPSFKTGMKNTATSTGKYIHEMFDVLGRANNNGGLDKFFKNTNKGFDNAVRGIRPFVSAIGTLGVVGSTFLPRMGTWFSDLGTSFGKFISDAEKSGRISVWIEEAITASQDLGDSIVGVSRMFQALTTASIGSGAAGLHEFAQGALDVAAVMQGEPFQSRLITILEGARTGTEFLGDAFGRLAEFVGKSSGALSIFLAEAGEIGGKFIDNITSMFDGTGMGAGLFKAFDGAKKAMGDLRPSFEDLGQLIGDIGEIAGQMFVHMAPGFNNLMATLSGAVRAIKDGILDAMPVFNAFIQSFVNLASGPIIFIAGQVGNLLTAFSKMDPILQTLILSLLAFILLKKRLVGFFDPLRKSTDQSRRAAQELGRSGVTMGDRIASGARTAGQQMKNISAGFGLMGSVFKNSFAGVNDSAKALGRALAAPFTSAWDSARLRGMYAMDAIKKGMSNLVTSAKTSMASVGSSIAGAFGKLASSGASGASGMGSRLLQSTGLNTIPAYLRSATDSTAKFLNNMKVQVPLAAGIISSSVAYQMKQLPSQVSSFLKGVPSAVSTGLKGVGPAFSSAFAALRDPNTFRSMFSPLNRELMNAAYGTQRFSKQAGGYLSSMGTYTKAAMTVLGTSIASGFATAGKAVSSGTFNMRTHLSNFTSAAGKILKGAISNPVTREIAATGKVFGSGMAPIVSTIGRMGADVRSGVAAAVSGVGNVATAAARGVTTAVSAVSPQVAAMATRTTTAMSTAASSVGKAFSGAASTIGGIATRIGSSMGGAATAVGRSFAGAAATVGGHAAGIANAFKPSIIAAGNLGASMMGGFGGAIKSMGDLRAAASLTAGAIGTGLKKGVVGAVSGLTGALGGPWGIAIMGAIALLGQFGAANAKEKAKVDGLTSSLDTQSGSITAASKKLIAENWLDTGRTSYDDFIRGLGGLGKGGAHNAEEIAAMMGMDKKNITDAIAGPQSRKAVSDAWNQLAEATKGVQSGFGKGTKDLSKISDETLKIAGITREAFTNASNVDIMEMQTRISAAAKTAEAAQAKFKLLADATGVNSVAAAKLSANYDVLASNTSSASDKFSALKSNLDIISKGMLTAQDSTQAYEQSVDDTGLKLREMNDSIKGGISSLVNTKGAFDLTSQSGRDLRTALTGQADAILQTSITAFQAARDGGSSLVDAKKKAMDAIAKPISSLRTSLETEFGLTKKQVEGVIQSLGLVPDKIDSAISMDTEEAMQKVINLQIAAQAFASGNYLAALKVLPDDAKKAIEDATGVANGFAKGDYKAMLDVMDHSKAGVDGFLAAVLTATKGDYSAVLKLKDETLPPLKAAKSEAENWAGLTFSAKLSATDTAKPVAINTGNFIQDAIANKNFDAKLTATNNTAPGVMAAQGTIDSVIKPTHNTGISAINNTGPGVASADSSIEAMLKRPKVAPITATNNTAAGVAAASGTISSVIKAAHNAALTATNNTGPGVSSAAGSINSIKDRTVFVKAQADQASINAANSYLNSLQTTRTAWVVTKYTSDGSAPGHGKQTAANGAILDGRGGFLAGFAPGFIKAFANGGVEKHVAQISAPKANTVRVWSEPETGGEAYIPLSPAKRPRSMAILEEVAKMFGVGIVKKFANGGIDNAASNTSVSASTLLANISKAILSDSGQLTKIGVEIVNGITSGIDSNVSQTEDSAKSLSNALVGTVKSTLQIHSPSKVFLGLGKNIVDGLTVGVKTTGAQATKAMSALSNKLYVNAKDVAKATKKSTASSINMINHQASLSKAWNRLGANKFSDQIVAYYKKTGKTDKYTIRDVVSARDNMVSRLSAANKKLADMQKNSNELMASTSSSIRGEYKLGTGILTDKSSYVPSMEFSDVKNYTTNIANRLRTFNSKIQQLAKKGVAPALIQEIAELGSAEGGAVADAILQGSAADIKGLNSSYASITTLSNNVGRSTADAMYRVGINAQQGLVNGLSKNASALTDAANKMTASLIKQVKKNLGIKSPSRVFMQIGGFISQGVIDGLDALQPAVDARVDSLVNPSPRNISLLGTDGSSTDGKLSSSNGSSTGPSVSITVNPAPGMSEEQIGDAVWGRAWWEIDRKTT